jgi:chemotaxis protein MotB
VGCNQSNPLIANRPAGWPGAAQPQMAWNPANELSRRANALDADNRDLHSELAKSQQQVQLLNDKLALLSKQLADTAGQLQAEQLAKQEAERRAETIQASTRMRGGATITANNSLARSLEMVTISGVEVRRDNDVIRIELPSDRLFVSGTAQLQGSAQYLLDQVADAVTRSYSRQLLGIEAHTDANPAGSAATQQLAASQAVAVFNILTTRSRIPANQLFTVAHGANHPLASNATPAGRAKNRRIEIVVYPETVGQR